MDNEDGERMMLEAVVALVVVVVVEDTRVGVLEGSEK